MAAPPNEKAISVYALREWSKLQRHTVIMLKEQPEVVTYRVSDARGRGECFRGREFGGGDAPLPLLASLGLKAQAKVSSVMLRWR